MMGELKMFGLLLAPKCKEMFRPGRSRDAQSLFRYLFFAGLGLAFALGIYFGVVWFLRQCLEVELVGALIPKKLMSWVLLILLSILLLSSTISSFSIFFLSSDLTLLKSLPIPVGPLYFARFVEMVLHSSWMVIGFGLPVFLAYGKVYQASGPFYMALAGFFPALILIPTAIGAVVAALLTRVFSARRSRDLLVVLVMVGFVFLYLVIRAMRPERLLDEESFGSMVEFINMFQTPSLKFLPSMWMTEALFPLLQGKAETIATPLLAVWLTAGVLLSINGWVGCALYDTGFARAQEGSIKRVSFLNKNGKRDRILGTWLDKVAGRAYGVTLAMLVKDLRIFFRNPGQWLQLMLLGALAGVYLLNFGYLKHARFGWFTLYTVNHVLVGLVLAGVAVRLVFPAVSLEGKAYWIIRSAPLESGTFLHGKLLGHFAPMACLGLILTGLTCGILEVHAAFVVLSIGIVLAMSLGICALAVGIGAIYPKFEAESPAKIPTGIGGVVYMIAGCVFVVALLLTSFYPTWVLYNLPGFHTEIRVRTGLLVWSSACTIILVVAASWLPMVLGRRNLDTREE